ncbi:MAG: accessory factor UbiK family protein [Pseudomonadales bacterium]
MNQHAQTPLETLLGRLPESLRQRVRPVLDGFLEEFELVPRRDYDAHLATLARLEETVRRLESRIGELERQR